MVATPYTDPVTLSNAPLSLLPPDLAGQVETLRYVWAGTAAVFIWDVLNNLKADYELLFNYNIRWPVVAYFTSRIVCLVYVIGFTIFLTYPVGGCRFLDLVLDSLYPVAVPATSLLFFFRVRAIYAGNRTVTIVFGLLWLAELAACITVPFGTGGVNIGATPYCIIAELAPYTGAASIMPTVFDTAVFVAISYRFVGNTHLKYSWREMCCALVSGAALPVFSKALFRDGQVYYMITVLSNIALSVMVYAPGVSPGSRSLPVVLNLMLTSVMACRVYRHTRLRLAQASQIVPSSTHAPAPRRNGGGNDSLPLHFLCPLPDTTRKEVGGDFGGEGMEGRKGGALRDSSRTSMAEECPLGKDVHTV
ncbi:hypothetical protein DFH09DRAFT_1400206 [Mycena vulgaris]|nr:hypothetical protein DFH09DRAFT_1400206 [Mycena vulgaris]